jgi:tRNA dimethylallyltransferase
MVAQGLEAEVHGLLAYKDLPVMRTVGYSEYFDYFEGKLNQEQAVSLIKQKTRNYAKRQITWFKNKTTSEWMDLNSLEQLYLK